MAPQEKYKLSRYNVFHQDGDVKYVWNTYSDAVLKLDKKDHEYITSFAGVDDKSDEFNILKDNGFIILEQLDELGRIKIHEKQALFSRNTNNMSIVIAPGMGCNYNCTYCFQASIDKSEAMTPETAFEVAEYICNRLKNFPNTKKLNIIWFGGEPLLYVDIIETISHKVMEYTKQNKIEYSADIVTNGRLLDPTTLTKLKELCIVKAQITVDGTRELYCKSKGVPSEDFDCVINNICSSIGKIKISIRLNIPNNDSDEAIAITDYLLSQHNLLGKANVTFGYVRDHSLSENDAQQAFNNFVHEYLLWENYVIEHYGISQIIKALDPKRRLIYCGKLRMGNVCIGSCGELYKCHRDFGHNSRLIGNIKSGEFYNATHLLYCSSIDTPQKHDCLQCTYLPVCMGGCANYYLTGEIELNCEAAKYLWLQCKLNRVIHR